MSLYQQIAKVGRIKEITFKEYRVKSKAAEEGIRA